MGQTSSNQQFTALTGLATVSTANANLDGTGAMSSVLTATQNGTIIKSITLKCQENNAQGVLRLFIQNGQTTTLWREVMIGANVQSSVVSAYQTTIRPGFALQEGDVLLASTQNAETWNIIAEGVSWTSCSCD